MEQCGKYITGEERNIQKKYANLDEGYTHMVTLLRTGQIRHFTNLEDAKIYCFMMENQIPSLRDVYFSEDKQKWVPC